MKKLVAIITIFLSFNVFANNMKPMQIAYYAKENKTDYSFYTGTMNTAEIEAFKACHLSEKEINFFNDHIIYPCLLYTSPSPRDLSTSRMPSSA